MCILLQMSLRKQNSIRIVIIHMEKMRTKHEQMKMTKVLLFFKFTIHVELIVTITALHLEVGVTIQIYMCKIWTNFIFLNILASELSFSFHPTVICFLLKISHEMIVYCVIIVLHSFFFSPDDVIFLGESRKSEY